MCLEIPPNAHCVCVCVHARTCLLAFLPAGVCNGWALTHIQEVLNLNPSQDTSYFK
jgi:hypothetical protein